MFLTWFGLNLKAIFSTAFSHSPDVNYEELARCTDDFNGAQCKAVCVEAVSNTLHSEYIKNNCWKSKQSNKTSVLMFWYSVEGGIEDNYIQNDYAEHSQSM